MFRDTHHGKACKYCKRQMTKADARLHPTRDHWTPVSRFHLGMKKVIVVCCATCNGIKADMLPQDWTAFMAAHPGWWTLSRTELRAIRRKDAGLPPRRSRHLRYLQGTAPAAPIVVPPPLIYGSPSQ